jgi:hypothetical protein
MMMMMIDQIYTLTSHQTGIGEEPIYYSNYILKAPGFLISAAPGEALPLLAITISEISFALFF